MTLSKGTSGAVLGMDGMLITVEVDLALGLPNVAVVGLPDSSVRAARARVEAALKNSGYEWPRKRITVSLAPAEVRKEGSRYDLPIALGVLAADEEKQYAILNQRQLEGVMVAGELSLDGRVRPVSGVLPMCIAARDAGLGRVIIPQDNAREGAVVEGIEVFGVSCLSEAVDLLSGRLERDPERPPNRLPSGSPLGCSDLADVRG